MPPLVDLSRYQNLDQSYAEAGALPQSRLDNHCAGMISADPAVDTRIPQGLGWLPLRQADANRNGHNASGDSLLPGWDARQLWHLSMLLCVVVATCDAVLGPHLILIGLLSIGPCCALLTGRWVPTGLTGAFALALGTLLGVPDGIFATYAHYAFLAAVAVTAASTTLSAAYLQRCHTR